MQNVNTIGTRSITSPARVNGGSAESAPKHLRFTSDEYNRLAELGVFEGKRVELIEGELIEMAPMGPHHAVSTVLAADVLRAIFVKGFFISSQNQLDVDERSQPEPDVAVVKGSPRDYVEFHPRTLVLAVEVADSSLDFDRDVKSRIYAKAGIEDFWIVNLKDRCVEVFRRPVEDPNLGLIYSERVVFGEDKAFAPLAKPKSKIKVADLLP